MAQPASADYGYMYMVAARASRRAGDELVQYHSRRCLATRMAFPGTERQSGILPADGLRCGARRLIRNNLAANLL